MEGENMLMKSVLIVALSLFMLAGCGDEYPGSAIGTMDEPSRDENQEAGPVDYYDDGGNGQEGMDTDNNDNN